MSLADLLITAQNGSHPACKNCPWNPSWKHINRPAYGVSCIKHGINWKSNIKAKSMLIAQDPAGTTPEKTGNLCGYCNTRFSTDHSAQHGFSLWKAAVSLIDSGPDCIKYMTNHYWTNAIMHGIKDDNNRELARRCCQFILSEQINFLSPQVIIVTGKVAAESAFDLGLISKQWDEFKNDFPKHAHSEQILLPTGSMATVFCTFHGSATAVNTHVARLYSEETQKAIMDRINQLPDPMPAQRFLRQYQGSNSEDKGMKVLLLHWLDIGYAIRQANMN
ncbi:MAG: uracil-DNA glycosylase family protein [Bacteroidales bacterium]